MEISPSRSRVSLLETCSISATTPSSRAQDLPGFMRAKHLRGRAASNWCGRFAAASLGHCCQIHFR
eukprot:2550562-Pyramimonas_sp.AAC.1